MNTLIENFNRYIEEKGSNYAVMLKGDWGSGKSYFIEEKWLKDIDENKYDIKNVEIEVYNTKGFEKEENNYYSLNEIQNIEINF